MKNLMPAIVGRFGDVMHHVADAHNECSVGIEQGKAVKTNPWRWLENPTHRTNLRSNRIGIHTHLFIDHQRGKSKNLESRA